MSFGQVQRDFSYTNISASQRGVFDKVVCDTLIVNGVVPQLNHIYTFDMLPTATDSQGLRFLITDGSVALATNFGSTAVGTGTIVTPVFSDGTNWLIG
jgi:hypothetical protein